MYVEDAALNQKIADLRSLKRLQEDTQTQIDALIASVKAEMEKHGADVLSGPDWKVTKWRRKAPAFRRGDVSRPFLKNRNV